MINFKAKREELEKELICAVCGKISERKKGYSGGLCSKHYYLFRGNSTQMNMKNISQTIMKTKLALLNELEAEYLKDIHSQQNEWANHHAPKLISNKRSGSSADTIQEERIELIKKNFRIEREDFIKKLKMLDIRYVTIEGYKEFIDKLSKSEDKT
jgi:uncharacterized C2H2 Zn-finger protein